MTLRTTALAILLLACAGAPPARADGEASDALADDLPLMMPGLTQPQGVRRITDGTLTCGQIEAEARTLEVAMLRHRLAWDEAQRDAAAAQSAAMRQAEGGMATPIASTLLGLVPGGGMVSGMAAQAALSAQRAAMQKGAEDISAAYLRMAQAQEQLASAQARNDHLVALFLQRNCTLQESVARPGLPHGIR